MPETALQIDPRDNVLVALVPLAAGTAVNIGQNSCHVTENIPAKHKLALVDLKTGDLVTMYGMVVGEATQPIARGGLLSTRNVRHRTGGYTAQRHPVTFALPDAASWSGRTFMGYHRGDGQVGTRNYWLVLPLVFCENRNVDRMREALEEELGYGNSHNSYRPLVRQMITKQASGGNGIAHESSNTSRPTSSPTLMASASSLTRGAAVARARTRRRSAACSPAISIIPTLPAQLCSASAVKMHSPVCSWTNFAPAIPS